MKTFRKWDKSNSKHEMIFNERDCQAFYRAFKNYLKRCFPNADLVGFKYNHFDTSGFVCQDGVVVYISHDVGLWTHEIDFNASDCGKGVLYRTAETVKDFRGGMNRFCSINDLQRCVSRLIESGVDRKIGENCGL